ncbi:hypothetical protein ACS0TY_007528 [Phlomoides rotata]
MGPRSVAPSDGFEPTVPNGATPAAVAHPSPVAPFDGDVSSSSSSDQDERLISLPNRCSTEFFQIPDSVIHTIYQDLSWLRYNLHSEVQVLCSQPSLSAESPPDFLSLLVRKTPTVTVPPQRRFEEFMFSTSSTDAIFRWLIIP